jgi:hypothetical protein
MAIKKFAMGGLSDLLGGVSPLPGSQPATTAQQLNTPASSGFGGSSGAGSSGAGAYGGLDSIQQGAGQIGQSLGAIKDALGNTTGGGAAQPRGAFFKKGGKVKAKKAYKAGGAVKSSASKRADGCAVKGKTRGRMV